jgi:hypothetical protein
MSWVSVGLTGVAGGGEILLKENRSVLRARKLALNVGIVFITGYAGYGLRDSMGFCSYYTDDLFKFVIRLWNNGRLKVVGSGLWSLSLFYAYFC